MVERSPVPRTERDIQGFTKICSVLTGSAYYSFSPAMHNRGYIEDGISKQFAYTGMSVQDEFLVGNSGMTRLEAAILGVRANENQHALSVGTPHKLTIIPLLDEIDNVARKIGAVNTVLISRDKDGVAILKGTNTDYLGIATPIKMRVPDLADKKVAVIGAAGAARAAVYAMTEEGANVKVFNRSRGNAERLARNFEGVETGSLADLQEVEDYDIIIHATKVGMENEKSLIPSQYIKPEHVIFDAVYHRDIEETDLMRLARENRATAIEGLEMVFWQGIEQYMLFTNQKRAPIEAMREELPRFVPKSREEALAMAA